MYKIFTLFLIMTMITLFLTDVTAKEGGGNFGSIVMIYIPGGEFKMGSPPDEKERGKGEDQHRVEISPFYMSKYETTQRQYLDIYGINPSEFKGDDLPVENIRWYDAIEFCNKLSKKYGLRPYYTVTKGPGDKNNRHEYDRLKYTVTIDGGDGFRLPTEAEWEYACRAGTTGAFYFGNFLNSEMANFNGDIPYNAKKGPNMERTTPVGSFRPNTFGLYDMHGNVWEWCWDWYGEKYYTRSTGKDPRGPEYGRGRVLRGGSWISSSVFLRSAYRFWGQPDLANFIHGFRVARSAIENKPEEKKP